MKWTKKNLNKELLVQKMLEWGYVEPEVRYDREDCREQWFHTVWEMTNESKE